MGRRTTHPPLDVYLNGRLVGVLRREASGAIDFRYAPAWLAWDHCFPISLSLPLREDRYIGAPVVNVFDNLLPDSLPIRKQIATRIGAAGSDPYSLLTALGHDCVGALQFLPEGQDPERAGSVTGQPVSEADIATLLRGLATAPLGLTGDDDFRISIAGAQEKTALLRQDGQWFKPSGLTATTHILKPRIGQLPNGIDLSDSVENEYLCLRLMAALGVPTADAEIVDFDDCRALAITRFDRHWTKDGRLLRLPQEDCCQALSVPPTQKYQSDGGPDLIAIARLLKGSDTPETDITAFFRAILIFWMIGATDGHAKNFSLFLKPGGRFRMTPVYDVLTAQPSLDADQIGAKSFRLAMSVGTNRHYAIHDIMPRHFLQTADRAGIGRSIMRGLFDDLGTHAVSRTEVLLADLPELIPAFLKDSVFAAIRKRAHLIADCDV